VTISVRLSGLMPTPSGCAPTGISHTALSLAMSMMLAVEWSSLAT